MTNHEGANAQRDVLDPGELLRQIYVRKWILILFTLAVGVVVYVFSRFLPNTYEASAGIAVRAPEIPITGESAPLTVETLRALADSTEVKATVFRHLRGKNVFDEGIGFGVFLKMLTVHTEEAASKKDGLLPMMRLSAISTSSQTAADIANAWADVVTSHTRSMYASGIEDLSRFIGELCQAVQSRLDESENAYVSKRAGSNAQVKKAILDKNNGVMAETHAQLKKLQAEIAVQEVLLETARRNILEAEFEGRWIGETLYSRFKEGVSTEGLPVSSPQTQRVASVIRSLLASEARLAELREKSGSEEKKIELESAEELLNTVLTNETTAQSELASNEAKGRAAQEELHGIAPTITLRKAITDDALWQTFLQGKALEGGISPLQTEEANPVHQTASASLMEFRISARGSSETLSALRKKETVLRERIGTLSAETSLLDAEIDFYDSQIAADNAVLKVMGEEFTKNRKDQEVLEREQERSLAEAAEKQKVLDALVRESKALEEEIIRNEQEIETLKRDVDKMRSVSDSLSSKAEEITLLKISAERVSRSGATILYRAHPDPKKVGPYRKKMVLGSMAGCFFLLSVLIVFRDIMRES